MRGGGLRTSNILSYLVIKIARGTAAGVRKSGERMLKVRPPAWISQESVAEKPEARWAAEAAATLLGAEHRAPRPCRSPGVTPGCSVRVCLRAGLGQALCREKRGKELGEGGAAAGGNAALAGKRGRTAAFPLICTVTRAVCKEEGRRCVLRVPGSVHKCADPFDKWWGQRVCGARNQSVPAWRAGARAEPESMGFLWLVSPTPPSEYQNKSSSKSFGRERLLIPASRHTGSARDARWLLALAPRLVGPLREAGFSVHRQQAPCFAATDRPTPPVSRDPPA
ncbi:uncharacterized protein LOC129403482 [Sorex araneus]|uniref:uncharacterized protein LOC129403482 n=1 Tax=Sorex araneus TaxID=42254 RepID=UPI002433A797|nr:uncharacterized protein LOC129403482 [Sorex araneus]